MTPEQKHEFCKRCSRYFLLNLGFGKPDPRCLMLGTKIRLLTFIHSEECFCGLWSKPLPTRPVQKRNLLGKVTDYVRAKLGPKASEALTAARLSQCLSEECGHLVKKEDGKLFCGACGCGERDEAELHNKTTMYWAKCPVVPSYWEDAEKQLDLKEA